MDHADGEFLARATLAADQDRRVQRRDPGRQLEDVLHRGTTRDEMSCGRIATNRDLRAAVAAGTFREDLHFCPAGFVITVPPLRGRREGIPPLAHNFVRRAATKTKKDVGAVSADAMTALMNYKWPANVRELEHAIERFAGNRRQAAEALKIGTVTLWRKMKQYGLVRSSPIPANARRFFALKGASPLRQQSFSFGSITTSSF